MNESTFGKIWKFINSPLIVVVVALLIWPLLTVISGTWALSIGAKKVIESVKEPFQKISKNDADETRDFLNIQKQIEILKLKTVPSQWQNKEKVIGTILNKSGETLQQIHIIASFYNAAGEVIDVTDKWISEIKALPPGESYDFALDRDLGSFQEDKEILKSRTSNKVKARLSSFTILKASDKK